MKKFIIKVLTFGVLVGLATFASAAPATLVKGYSSYVFDAECTLWWVKDPHSISVEKTDKFIKFTFHTTLPEEAVLPDKTIKGPVSDCGFAGCVDGDDGCTYRLTPSGNFSLKAHKKY